MLFRSTKVNRCVGRKVTINSHDNGTDHGHDNEQGRKTQKITASNECKGENLVGDKEVD